MRRRRLTALAGVTVAVTLVSGAPAHASPDIPDDLTGFYYTHSGGMTVRKAGTITVTYQWYYKRDRGLPSFPRLTLRTGKVRGETLKGRVVAQVDARVATGSRFTIKHRPPGMRLRVTGMPRVMVFCDPVHKEQGACGA